MERDDPQVGAVYTHRAVTAVAYSADGVWLVGGSEDGSIQRWHLGTGEATVVRAHDRPVRGVVFSPDSTILASAAEDRHVRLWDLASRANAVESYRGGALTGDLVCPTGVRAVAFHPDGTAVASGDSDGRIVVWGLVVKTTVELTRDVDRSGGVWSVAHHPGGAEARTAPPWRARAATAWCCCGGTGGSDTRGDRCSEP